MPNYDLREYPFTIREHAVAYHIIVISFLFYVFG